MSGSSTKQTSQNTSSQQSPWAPQIPYLTQGFSDAQSALNKANANGINPSGFVAGLTPDQLATFNSMVGYGQGGANGIPSTAANTGNTLANSGTGATTGALNALGGFNPAANNNMGNTIAGANQYAAGQNIPDQVKAAMLSANQEARDVTLPGIDQNAALTGNTNSSRTGLSQGLVQRGLAEQAGALSAELQGNAYNTGAALTNNQNTTNNAALLSALQSRGALGTTAANTGVNAGTQSIGDQGNLYTLATAGGAGQQAGTQATYDNQNQAYQFSQQSPFQALSNYMGLIQGNYGGTTTGTATGTETSTPSIYSIIGGLMNAGGSLLGSKGGGGGSGLLGMGF